VYQIEKQYSDKDTLHANPTTVPSMFARRSDGSQLQSFTVLAPDGNSVQTTEITDLQKNQYIFLDSASKTMTTFHQSPGALIKGVEVHQGCPAAASSPSVQKGVFLGHPIAVYRDDAWPAGGADVMITAALDLDCYPLKVTESFAGAFNQTEVSLVLPGEPPDSLFNPPSDYREVSPTQRSAEYEQRYPGHSFWDQGQLAQIERRYEAGR